MPAFNEVSWFEIGTGDAAGAERFYGEVFGWRFTPDETVGQGYHLVSTGEDGPRGGLYQRDDLRYATFVVAVQDVAETLKRAEAAGGSRLGEPTTTSAGLRFGYLRDPAGNLVGVFTPPPGRG